ncbi:myosin-1 [Atheta coriaria]|uniref:myosin-1 n=1 Tax=Dalotia coriaria TaxID=877792 RepID=UPI0031F364B9
MSKFDLDDPLGDLLSNGSDDSFFDNPKPKTKRPSTAKSPEKKSVSDLFGLEDAPAPIDRASRAKDDWLGLETQKTSSTTIPSSPVKAKAKPAKKISFEDDDDILNTLGLEKKAEPKKNDAKKSSLMESILGQQKTKEDNKQFLSLDDLLQESKGKKHDMPATVTQSASQLTDKSTIGMSSLDTTREGRRGRVRSANISDPLGLLQNNQQSVELEAKPRRRDLTSTIESKPEHPTEIIQPISAKSNLGDVSDWLGGTQVKKVETENTVVPPANVSSVLSTSAFPPHADPTNTSHMPMQGSIDNLLTQQKLAASHIEYQNTSIALQQQESQLLMALQLKKYEDNMGDMQRKQQEILMKQEQQFNTLLDKQFTKQQIMENNMRLQQERINNHIQMLISQPAISSALSPKEMERLDDLQRTSTDEMIKQYEEIVVNLKQRHHEEIFLLEESYKKQISTLEQSMESVENHLKMELDSLTSKQKDKVDAMEEEFKIELGRYQKKIEEQHQLHDAEIRQMRENSNRVVEEVKYEYNTIIENLKSSKNLEHSVLTDAHEYTQKLDASLKLLDINSRSILDIKEKVHGDYNVLSLAREESLKAKQQEIESMRVTLEKARELADQERAQLMAVVRNLELKLAEHSQNTREERFALQQAASTLAARAAALDREADFNRQSLERERQQLKVLRETILAEQEKSLHELTEEKIQLHSERVRLETASKLNPNYDAQRAKAEVEAAIQVAKEAAEMTDRERENLIKQIREIETLKRTLLDKESRLKNRERDLDVAMEHANRKNLLGEKALEDARIIQMNYNDKLREMQAQISSMNMRERKLAEDKIAISKERLTLHSNARQLKKCGLCAVENHQINEDHESNLSEPVEHDMPRFISVSDADMFRLQLQMSEEQLSSNQDIEKFSAFRG